MPALATLTAYLDRHLRTREIEDQLAEAIVATDRRGGNVLIPTFAIERAQQQSDPAKRAEAAREAERATRAEAGSDGGDEEGEGLIHWRRGRGCR